jgi:hypothetical protein
VLAGCGIALATLREQREAEAAETPPLSSARGESRAGSGETHPAGTRRAG